MNLSADAILDGWAADRRRSVLQLDQGNTNDRRPFSVFSNCNECRVSGGRHNNDSIGKGFSTPGSCHACFALSTLRADGNIESELVIEGGEKYVGSEYTILPCRGPLCDYTVIDNETTDKSGATGPNKTPWYLQHIAGTSGHDCYVSAIIENEIRKWEFFNMVYYKLYMYISPFIIVI